MLSLYANTICGGISWNLYLTYSSPPGGKRDSKYTLEMSQMQYLCPGELRTLFQWILTVSIEAPGVYVLLW